MDSYFFMSLDTGRKIHSRKWMELSVDDSVIENVETIAFDQKQPLMPDNFPIFEWGPGIAVDDGFGDDDGDVEDADDEEYFPEAENVLENVYDNNNVVSDDEVVDGNDEELSKKMFL